MHVYFYVCIHVHTHFLSLSHTHLHIHTFIYIYAGCAHNVDHSCSHHAFRCWRCVFYLHSGVLMLLSIPFWLALVHGEKTDTRKEDMGGMCVCGKEREKERERTRKSEREREKEEEKEKGRNKEIKRQQGSQRRLDCFLHFVFMQTERRQCIF